MLISVCWPLNKGVHFTYRIFHTFKTHFHLGHL